MLFIGLPSATEAWSEILAGTSDLSVASPPGGTKGRVTAWHGHQGQPLRSDRKRLTLTTGSLGFQSACFSHTVAEIPFPLDGYFLTFRSWFV